MALSVANLSMHMLRKQKRLLHLLSTSCWRDARNCVLLCEETCETPLCIPHPRASLASEPGAACLGSGSELFRVSTRSDKNGALRFNKRPDCTSSGQRSVVDVGLFSDEEAERSQSRVS